MMLDDHIFFYKVYLSLIFMLTGWKIVFNYDTIYIYSFLHEIWRKSVTNQWVFPSIWRLKDRSVTLDTIHAWGPVSVYIHV